MNDMLNRLELIVKDRKNNPKPNSYTSGLFDSGLNRIAQKVGEEGVEVVIAVLGQGREEQIGEIADLFFHTLVLMAQIGISLDDIHAELERRYQPK